jgi:transcriptional regulator with XRE-family HTH domain
MKRKVYTRSAARRRFSQAIRARRRQLELTQEQVARRTRLSLSFVGNLEKARRRPSDETIFRLAKVLGFDSRELFLLANTHARTVLDLLSNDRTPSAWDQFRNDHKLRRIHKITKGEMELLASVASLGELHAPHEFIYVLNAVRQAIGR